MRRGVLSVLSLLVVAIALVGPARPAAAHAVLLATTPADRANLADAPGEVTLEFNEPVSAALGAVRAFDGSGERVDTGDLLAEGARLRLALRDGLGAGAYIVTYRVISQDAHPISGAFAFTVGDAAAADDRTIAGLLGEDDDRMWHIAGAAARSLAYAGALVAAGLGAFLVVAHDGGDESGRLRRWLRRSAAGGAAGLLATLPIQAALATGLGIGALFDPAKPTDYRSRIDSVTPPVEGVHVTIVGGDSFLRLQVDPGRTVVVEGYAGEPYLQYLDDGTVQENRRSPATYLNEDRYGLVDEPAGLDPDAEPDWRTIDDDGEHAWHDHRIHWMSPDRRPGVEPGEIVQTQDVPLDVDGTPVAVTVSVVLEHGISPLPWIALGAVGLAVAAALGWRRRSLLVAVGAALLASVLAVVAGQGEHRAVPPGAGGSPLVVVVPAVALASAVLAAVLLARRRAPLSGIASLASAAALGGWALLRLTVLWKPVLPTDLPFGLDRAATSLAVAGAVAVAALTLRSGAVTPTPLTDDE